MSFPEILRFFIRISLRIIGTGSSTRNSEPMYLSPMIPIAISYSQHGIQIGIGPNIHICRNQTILGAKQMIANFGYRRLAMDKKDLAGPDWWRPTVEGWIDEVRGISDLAFGNNATCALKK